MQAAFFQPQCQSCRLWLLMAYKGRHCLLVTSASLQNVKKKKRRRCCCGSSSPRTTTPLLPEERSPFSGFLLCFSGDYQLTCAAASSKGEGKYASSKQLCTTKSSTTTPSATTVTTGTTVMSLVFMAVHFRFKMVSVSASSSICLDTFVEEILKRTQCFTPAAGEDSFFFPLPFRSFLKKKKFCPSSLHPRH